MRHLAGILAVLAAAALPSASDQTARAPGANPIFTDAFTADPAPLVVGDTLYMYVGHDAAKDGEMFNMPEWLCYSTKDMKHWTAHGPVMKPTDFKWAVADAWASQAVQKDGKFYLYTTVQHGPPNGGKAIGVAVSDSPTGPFRDARGSALVTDASTPGPYGWDDIDPTVLIDDDGTAWLAWGNPNCHLAKLKPNMVEIDGPIRSIHVPNYTEGPWLAKRNGLYYLFYAAFAHQGMGEKVCYATAKKITGPWTYRDVLTGDAEGSYTIHPGVADFRGQSYFFYHNATLTLNGQRGTLGRRSVCAEYLAYNPDGTIRPVKQTREGLSVPPESGALTADGKSPLFAHSDPGVRVKQELGPDPTSWPGRPTLRTVGNPYDQAPMAISFNARGRPTRIGQTFRMEASLLLERAVLYAGDGFGATSEAPVTLAIYDLGEGAVAPGSYAVGKNLLGGGLGLKIAYRPQARGLLQIDFSRAQQIRLEEGYIYALELQGEPGSAPLFWRRSRRETYPDGAAYCDGNRLQEREETCDLALALYGATR